MQKQIGIIICVALFILVIGCSTDDTSKQESRETGTQVQAIKGPASSSDPMDINKMPNEYDDMMQYYKAKRFRDLELCKPIVNATRRSKCVAAMTKDFAFCNSYLLDKEWEAACVEKMKSDFILKDMPAYKMTSECHNLSFSAYNDCISDTAASSKTEAGDLAWCDKITVGDWARDHSVLCKAYVLGDETKCNEIKEPTTIPICVQGVAQKTGDIRICQKFDFSKLADASRNKDQCYFSVVYRTNNKSICETILDEGIKEKCKDLE